MKTESEIIAEMKRISLELMQLSNQAGGCRKDIQDALVNADDVLLNAVLKTMKF